MNKKYLVLVPLLITMTGALAVWLSGWLLTGAVIGTSGARPDVQTSTWDLNITGDGPISQVFTYNNGDGTKVVYLTKTENITSTELNCNYEEGKDLVFKSMWPSACVLNSTSSCPITMQSGANSINITVYPDQFRCGTVGTYSISFVI